MYILSEAVGGAPWMGDVVALAHRVTAELCTAVREREEARKLLEQRVVGAATKAGEMSEGAEEAQAGALEACREQRDQARAEVQRLTDALAAMAQDLAERAAMLLEARGALREIGCLAAATVVDRLSIREKEVTP